MQRRRRRRPPSQTDGTRCGGHPTARRRGVSKVRIPPTRCAWPPQRRPGDRRRPVQRMQPVGQPDVNIQRAYNSSDCPGHVHYHCRRIPLPRPQHPISLYRAGRQQINSVERHAPISGRLEEYKRAKREGPVQNSRQTVRKRSAQQHQFPDAASDASERRSATCHQVLRRCGIWELVLLSGAFSHGLLEFCKQDLSRQNASR